MEFINENLTLIIIIGVILVMTLIGYIADKSNFVEKRKEKEKNKKEQVDNEQKNRKTKEQQQFAAEIGDGKDLIMDEGSVDFPVELDRNPWEINIPAENNSENNNSNEQNASEDSLDFDIPADFSNNNETNLDNINTDEEITAPLNNDVLNLDKYDNDLSGENGNLEDDNKKSEVIPEETEDEKLADKEENVTEESNSENIEEENNDSNSDSDKKSDEKVQDNMPLPEIDSLKEVNDDDIWSF